jgi:hypothetical protein
MGEETEERSSLFRSLQFTYSYSVTTSLFIHRLFLLDLIDPERYPLASHVGALVRRDGRWEMEQIIFKLNRVKRTNRGGDGKILKSWRRKKGMSGRGNLDSSGCCEQG